MMCDVIIYVHVYMGNRRVHYDMHIKLNKISDARIISWFKILENTYHFYCFNIFIIQKCFSII